MARKMVINKERAKKKADKNTGKRTAKTAVEKKEGKAAWYNSCESMGLGGARLFNLRKTDCVFAAGKSIAKGTIITGTYGHALAEKDVDGVTVKDATVTKFKANAVISWQGKEYRAMVHKNGDSNYAVAVTTGAGGKQVLFNVEIEKGGNYRQKDKRAGLVKML